MPSSPYALTHSMPNATIRVVDVYPYRFHAGNLQFLLLRRAPGVEYAGQWRMLVGKIGRGETAWQAALREVQEETGQPPSRLWTLPSVNHFYEWQQDRINLIPAFAAELHDDPTLNHEHDDFAWWAPQVAASRTDWPEQQRLLNLTTRLLHEGVPAELAVDF